MHIKSTILCFFGLKLILADFGRILFFCLFSSNSRYNRIDFHSLYRYFQSEGVRPGNAGVKPEIVVEILKNMSKGEHPFKPELGNVGGCSWFVTEGNPYTSTGSDSIEIPCELVEAEGKLIFKEAQLLEMLEESKIKVEPAFKAKYMSMRGITEIPPKKLGKYTDALYRRAERDMWNRVGELVRDSESKVGEVILEKSKFSESGDGKFGVVADGSKIKVKGGISALIGIVRTNGITVDPVLVEAAEEMATKLKWAGTVRDVFRYGGRVIMVVGIASDVYKVYIAEDKVEAVVESQVDGQAQQP